MLDRALNTPLHILWNSSHRISVRNHELCKLYSCKKHSSNCLLGNGYSHYYKKKVYITQTTKFPLNICLVNVTFSCWFGHIYQRVPSKQIHFCPGHWSFNPTQNQFWLHLQVLLLGFTVEIYLDISEVLSISIALKTFVQRCSVKKVFRKTLMPEPEACNFIKKETLAQAFSCEFCESSKNTFSHRTPLVEKCRRKKRNRPTLWNLLKVTKNETKSKFVYLDSNLFKHIPHLKVLILLWQNLYHYF